MLVCIYVDDVLTWAHFQLFKDFQASMKNKFEMSDLGMLSYFLGLEVKQGHDGIFITQRKYIMDVLKSYNMTRCKTVSTRMNSNERLITRDSSEAMDAKVFRCFVRKLMYVTHTCLDISFVVEILSRFMNRPSKHHFGAGKCMLRYLPGSLQHGLLYTHTKECKLEGYIDNDWGGSLEDRKSTSRMVFSVGSTAISWNSKKQEITVFSMIEV